MITSLSFLSLMLAGGLPIIAMFHPKNYHYCSFFSAISCALGIWLQYRYLEVLIQKADWNAMMDIVPTLQKFLGLAILGTILINVILWWRVAKIKIE